MLTYEPPTESRPKHGTTVAVDTLPGDMLLILSGPHKGHMAERIEATQRYCDCPKTWPVVEVFGFVAIDGATERTMRPEISIRPDTAIARIRMR